jgi:hypothetical protein
MSSAQNPRTFAFGDDNSLIGTITDPPNAGSRVAAILWGMGIAEMRAARALANLGLVSFNAALVDPSVIGVIVTNPHVSEVLSVSSSYKRKLLSWQSWRHVLTGRATLARHVANIRWLKEHLLGRLWRRDEKSLIEKFIYNKDLTLPADIGGRLKDLAFRGVATLIIFSENDVSLDYFRQVFGKSLAELRRLPNVRVEVLSRTPHVISHDDEAAQMTVDFITHWAKRTVADRRSRRRPDTDQPARAHAVLS